MTIKIEVQNRKHIPNELVLQFVLNKVAEDAANGSFAVGNPITADYYIMNGIEYRADIQL